MTGGGYKTFMPDLSVHDMRLEFGMFLHEKSVGDVPPLVPAIGMPLFSLTGNDPSPAPPVTMLRLSRLSSIGFDMAGPSATPLPTWVRELVSA